MVICLERSADLHMGQLMSLPLTVFASVKSRPILLSWYRLTQVVTEKGLLKRVYVSFYDIHTKCSKQNL